MVTRGAVPIHGHTTAKVMELSTMRAMLLLPRFRLQVFRISRFGVMAFWAYQTTAPPLMALPLGSRELAVAEA